MFNVRCSHFSSFDSPSRGTCAALFQFKIQNPKSKIISLFLTSYGEPFNPDVLSRMVSKWLKQADIGRPGSCHLVRHTAAVHLLEGGADIRFIQQFLGHEKLEKR